MSRQSAIPTSVPIPVPSIFFSFCMHVVDRPSVAARMADRRRESRRPLSLSFPLSLFISFLFFFLFFFFPFFSFLSPPSFFLPSPFFSHARHARAPSRARRRAPGPHPSSTCGLHLRCPVPSICATVPLCPLRRSRPPRRAMAEQSRPPRGASPVAPPVPHLP